jgi:hypothetical protein
MATLKDLLKSRQEETYGISGITLIESRGLVNIPRQAALLVSSPNAVADLIGNQIGGAFGGSAKRPSDTIFKNNLPFTKPISVIPTLSQLRNAVEEGETYFVKPTPAPGSIFAKLKQGGTSLAGMAQSAAIGAINQFGSKAGASDFKDYVEKLKNPDTIETYGGEKSIDPVTNKIKSKTHKFSEYATVYGKESDETSYTRKGISERKNTKISGRKSQWDIINEKVLKAGDVTEDDKTAGQVLKDLKKDNTNIGAPYVAFKIYGKETQPNSNIILPGTITGISEDFAPEINSFKYVGSPFNVYRYGGVERTLKFDLKMYYLDQATKISMKKNLDRLRQLVFPDENISAVEYNNSNGYSPLFFTPNLVYLTINGLYDDVLGIIDTLSFTIDDNTPWATTSNLTDGSSVRAHPTVINVSLGMKIIEHPAIKIDGKNAKFVYGESKENKYVNYFTGLDEYQTNYDEASFRKKIISMFTKQ